MKTTLVRGIMAASVIFAGCNKKENPSGGPALSTKEASGAAPQAVPVAQTALKAWQQGNKASAISSFVEADWSSRPLFEPGSTLNLSEAQFTALSNADREAKSNEMLPQIGSLKQLAAAVAQAGRDAAAKGEAAEARRYFTSLKQSGAAFDNPGNLSLLRLVGQAFSKSADAELAKLVK